jgi:two-component system heavy metal sensor histidine kinase CusS
MRALRASMTAQIVLAITAVSVALVAGSSLLILRMASETLRDGGELLMLSNLAYLHDDLETSGFDVERVSQRLVNRIEGQLGSLHVAVLDEQGRAIALSDWFDVPLAALPARPLALDDLPSHITHEKLRWLKARYGPLAQTWVAPDGRLFRLLMARVPLPAGAVDQRHAAVRVALALETTHTREVVARGWKIFAWSFLLSAGAAGLVGLLLARRIVVAARRLGASASRISAQALHERLRPQDVPRELRESVLAFNRMLQRLEAAFKRLSEFSSDLAHDLRTPISNLLGEAQVALSRPREAHEYRAVLESAVEEHERISRLIENMLFLARADDARASLQWEWVNLHESALRMQEYFEPLAEDHGVAIRFSASGAGDAGDPTVWVDRTLLRRAVANLVSNALRHASPGSNVDIEATLHAGGAFTLEVGNEGPPIAPEHQARIFDRLYRVDPSRQGSASGSGLGLAIVKSIMELHGGQATVRSAPGQRTVFTLSFPVARGERATRGHASVDPL